MSEKEKKHKEHGKHAEQHAGDVAQETQETASAASEDAPADGGKAAADAQGASVNADAAADNEGGDGADSASASEQSPEDRVAELEKQCAEYKDLYMRKAADFDNYRKRMIREKQEAIDFANSNLLVDLIQVLDDFDRAISASGEPEQGSPAAAFAEGVQMIRKQMASMLENKYGLTYYPCVGEAFDPNIHEAIGRVPAEDVSEPVVQEECRKGYKLKDRVIRLAQVIVKTPPEN